MQCSQADLTSKPRRDFPMSPFERLCLDFGSPPCNNLSRHEYLKLNGFVVWSSA